MEYDSLSGCLGGEMVDTQDSNLMLKSRTETEISRTLTIAHEFITILHPENQPHSDHQPLDSMEKKEGWESPMFFMNKKFIWSQRFGHPWLSKPGDDGPNPLSISTQILDLVQTCDLRHKFLNWAKHLLLIAQWGNAKCYKLFSEKKGYENTFSRTEIN